MLDDIISKLQDESLQELLKTLSDLKALNDALGYDQNLVDQISLLGDEINDRWEELRIEVVVNVEL